MLRIVIFFNGRPHFSGSQNSCFFFSFPIIQLQTPIRRKERSKIIFRGFNQIIIDNFKSNTKMDNLFL